jgi:hypothetical protein
MNSSWQRRSHLTETTIREVRDLLNALPDSALDTPFFRIVFLMRAATRINEYDVACCNREITAPEEGQWERDKQTVLFQAERLGCRGAIFNGEPLGPSVKLLMLDGRTNDFAREGWIVPYGDFL